MGMNTSTLQTIIDQEANRVLDQWTAEATGDVDSYIAEQMDILEDSEPTVVATISAAYLKRVLA